MTLRLVGILGGMGPESTVLLMQKIIESVQAEDDADHVPLIVEQNPQVPSRIAHLIDGTGDDPGPVLAGMARRLQKAGATALAMPCNTAHHYAATIRAATDVPFLDMVALASDHAASLAPVDGKVGILASPAVRKVGLYDAAFAAHGLIALYPEDEGTMLSTIRRIKGTGPDADTRAALIRASGNLLAQGAEVQMIACTEFSLIADAVAPTVKAFDTLDRLVDAIVTFSGASLNSRMPQQDPACHRVHDLLT